MVISRNTVRKDMLFAMIASLMLLLMCLDNELSRLDSVLLFVVFILFMVYTLRMAKDKTEEEETPIKQMNGWMAAGLMILGLACLVIGSNVFVDGATKIAKSLGVSDAVIGLTIVACGTSLPELATSVVAAKKGRAAIAIGNVIGSNVLNILMILGITGMIIPMDLQGITWIDMAVMMGGMMLLWGFSYTKFKIERWEGGVLAVIFIAYMCWLVFNAVR